MSHASTERHAMNRRLQALAAESPELAPPYDFAEFQQRAAAATPRLRASQLLRLAAVIAPLAMLLVIAGVRRDPAAPVDVLAVDTTLDTAAEPALVHAGATGAAIALEDRIAWFDAVLSQPPATGLDAEDRTALQSSRNVLADSLQRVRYAQTLLAY